MALSIHTTPFVKTGAVLLSGAAGFAVLYWAGLREIAWVGFLGAALIWSALDSRPRSLRDHVDAPGTGALTPTTLAAVRSGHYSVTPSSTRVSIKGRKLRFFTVHAAMDSVSGTVETDPSTGSTTIRGSLPVATFRSGNARRDLHILGPAFLDARAHPSIRFTSTAVDSTGGDRAAVMGDLTLKGRTHPVTWDVSRLAANPSGDTLRAVAETSIRRSDWGMTGWTWLVDDVIGVRLELMAVRSE